MKQCRLLDCTLRDGGYVNEWNFGKENIAAILEKLVASKLDVIECGYLDTTSSSGDDSSIFSSIEKIRQILPKVCGGSRFACMIDFGKVKIEDLPIADIGSIDYIRVAFHKKDCEEALLFCSRLIEKGYRVFVQPMVTMNYSDEELLGIIHRVNQMRPESLYIVDSFGSMRRQDVLRLCSLFDHNLSPEIGLGFHAHNNLQFAFSNAQAFWDSIVHHDMMIDCSVYGMGRGAGNLCTELAVEHFNHNMGTKYNPISLLEMIDEILLPIFQQSPWGYNAAYYLSATKGCHPNYAIRLMEKQTLRTSAIDVILERIPYEKRGNFDRELLDCLYLEYQTYCIDDHQALENLKSRIGERPVLLLAPGMTLKTHRELIQKYCTQYAPFVIAANFKPEFDLDLIFVSNRRRAALLGRCEGVDAVLYASNIEERPKQSMAVNYSDLINSSSDVMDNSGLMLLSLLSRIGVRKVALAGFDGFRLKQADNYYKAQLEPSDIDREGLLRKNQQMGEQIRKYGALIQIDFLTPTVYQF